MAPAFFCVLDKSFRPLTHAALRSRAPVLPGTGPHARTIGDVAGPFGFVANSGHTAHVLSETRGPLVAVGQVRLDNRKELLGHTGGAADGRSDLAVFLEAFADGSIRTMREPVGEFAVVIYNSATKTLVAARDAIGMRTLFYSEQHDVLLLASHSGLLNRTDRFDLEFIADFLVKAYSPDRSVWRDCQPLRPGRLLTYRTGLVETRFWRADEFDLARNPVDEAGKAEEFRHLCARGVAGALQPQDKTWVLLSGGVDSAAVVAAARLTETRERGEPGSISGSLTWADTLSIGDDGGMAALTARHFQLPNEQVRDFGGWCDDSCSAAPVTDEPGLAYPFFARDAHTARLLRGHDVTAVLTGIGPDHLLSSNRLHVLDLLCSGKVGDAVTDVASNAVATRQSFWRALYFECMVPMLPWQVDRHHARAGVLPAWITRSFTRQMDMTRRLPMCALHRAPVGHKYRAALALAIENLGRAVAPGHYGPLSEAVDIRHPLLYRPLIEFCLRLPPELRARPAQSKWLLRQAFRGLLPDAVSRRTQKGAVDGRIVWSLTRESERLTALVRHSVLADLGVSTVPNWKPPCATLSAGARGPCRRCSRRSRLNRGLPCALDAGRVNLVEQANASDKETAMQQNQESRMFDLRDSAGESSSASPQSTLNVLDYGDAVRVTRGDGYFGVEFFMDWGWWCWEHGFFHDE